MTDQTGRESTRPECLVKLNDDPVYRLEGWIYQGNLIIADLNEWKRIRESERGGQRVWVSIGHGRWSCPEVCDRSLSGLIVQLILRLKPPWRDPAVHTRTTNINQARQLNHIYKSNSKNTKKGKNCPPYPYILHSTYLDFVSIWPTFSIYCEQLDSCSRLEASCL